MQWQGNVLVNPYVRGDKSVVMILKFKGKRILLLVPLNVSCDPVIALARNPWAAVFKFLLLSRASHGRQAPNMM